jgi:hypothetical protein
LHITFPAVCDGLAGQIGKCVAFAGPTNCGWSAAWEWSAAEWPSLTEPRSRHRRRSAYSPVMRCKNLLQSARHGWWASFISAVKHFITQLYTSIFNTLLCVLISIAFLIFIKSYLFIDFMNLISFIRTLKYWFNNSFWYVFYCSFYYILPILFLL